MKYGVFGAGRAGRVHAKIVMDLGHEIVCIGDRREGASLKTKEVLSLNCDSYSSPEQMVSAHPEIEAAIVASHTKDHAHDALPFIKAGIPVYLEKPLTDDLPESFDFIEQIGRGDNVLQIGLQRRFDEALCYAKNLLDKGLIGEIREIRNILRDKYPPPPSYSSKGLIIDMGIHVADEAIWLTGEFPEKVWGRVCEAKGYESPIDEGGNTAFVGFTTPSAVIGRLDMSRTHSSGYNNETYIIGTNGTLHVGRFAGYPGPIPVELWTSEGKLHPASRTFEMSYLEGDYPEFLPRFEKAFIQAHKHFAYAVENKEPFRVTQNDVIQAQVFVEAAHRSALDNAKIYQISYSDDLEEFRVMCYGSNLLD
ncbi:MAG: Gfo/Idh/MocA family oxidoreductase [Thermodesulfobacteriota bacterium]